MLGSASVLERGTEIDRVWGIYGQKWVGNDLKGQKHAKFIKYNMWAYIWVILLGCGGLFHIFDILSHFWVQQCLHFFLEFIIFVT